jgi:hypothetical protein
MSEGPSFKYVPVPRFEVSRAMKIEVLVFWVALRTVL